MTPISTRPARFLPKAEREIPFMPLDGLVEELPISSFTRSESPESHQSRERVVKHKQKTYREDLDEQLRAKEAFQAAEKVR
jgi:hypothetical protein